MDEVFTTVYGERQCLWRGVDQDGDVLRYPCAKASRSPSGQALLPQAIARNMLRTASHCDGQTEKLRCSKKLIMPGVMHWQDKWENNRAEISHQPTRQRERQMRRFKSPGQAQRFLSAHGPINNLFRVGRHLLKAKHYRWFRDRAFSIWTEVTCVQTAA